VIVFLFQYEQLIEEFKAVHKDSEMLKNSGYSTSELRADIDTMEREKDIVVKRIERMQQKVQNKVIASYESLHIFAKLV